MSAGTQQLLAALVAAVIPVLVKLFNDWHERLQTAAPLVSAQPGQPYDQGSDGQPTAEAGQPDAGPHAQHP